MNSNLPMNTACTSKIASLISINVDTVLPSGNVAIQLRGEGKWGQTPLDEDLGLEVHSHTLGIN